MHRPLADRLELAHQGDRARAIDSCSRRGHVLDLADGSTRPAGFWRCRQPLCPTCSRIKAQARRRKLFRVLDHLADRPHRLLFLTLTVPNVRTAPELKRTIRTMRRALVRLRRRKLAGQPWLAWRGGAVALEVPASDSKGLHPHLHLLVEVPPAYFAKDRDLYRDQAELQAAWEDALHAEGLAVERAILHVQAVPQGRARAAGVEIAKYVTTADDVAACAPELLAELVGGTTGAHVLQAFGTWRELMADDDTDAELQAAEVELHQAGEGDTPTPTTTPTAVARIWCASWDGWRYRLEPERTREGVWLVKWPPGGRAVSPSSDAIGRPTVLIT